MCNVIDVSTFINTTDVMQNTRWLVVVKSQDQLERRQRMIKSRIGKGFGRIKPRPTSVGLLVCGRLRSGRFQTEWAKEFREPRHICRLIDDRYLLTEINRLVHTNVYGEILNSIYNDYFAFLHTLDISADRRRVLVVSSGYDTVIELDLQSGQETFRWVAWDHGFNPDEDGNWLTVDQTKWNAYRKAGKKTLLINPRDYGEQGLVTAFRSAHPNAATYDPFDSEESFIVSVGHKGELYRVSIPSGATEQVCNFLGQMPHGLFVYNSGWCVTDTTRGKWWITDTQFRPLVCYSFKQLGGKVAGTENVEWIQQIIPEGRSQALALDANRGLIAIDFEQQCYSVYQPDPNWCIQDALYF